MKIKHTLLALTAAALISTTAHAAIEINEADFGPTYGTAVLDVTVAKPLQLVGAIAGTALHVVGLPFSVASDSTEISYETLVVKPWSALSRCVGCTEVYDNHRNAHVTLIKKTPTRYALLWTDLLRLSLIPIKMWW